MRCPCQARLLGVVLAFAVMAVLASPTQAQVPACITGDWRASNLDSVFRELFAGSPELQVDSVTGDILLSIAGDGSFELRYAGFTMSLTTSSGPLTTVAEGPILGGFRETRPGSIVGTMTESAVNLTVTVAGMTVTDTFSLSEADRTESAVTYDCGGGRVTFTSAGPGAEQPMTLIFIRR